MHPKSPLEIPEVTSQIASYLEPIDLASCLRVSKAWQDIFLPYQYSVVKAGCERYCPWSRFRNIWIGPSPDTIWNHRDLIRDLWILGEPVLLQGESYPNVHILYISFDDNSMRPDQIISLDLIDMFPSLVQLTLLIVVAAPTLWMTLSLHPRISVLHLFRVEARDVDAPVFWRGFNNIEELHLLEVTIKSGRIPDGVVLPRMRLLEMSGIKALDLSTQMDLVLRCPRLTFLRWSDLQRTNMDERYFTHHPIQSGHWPCLDELHIGHPLEDADMASILNGVGNGFGNVVTLYTKGTLWEHQAFKALSLHFSTLVRLSLHECRSVASPAMQDILCGCPSLENLSSITVFARDITEGGPWVCLQLRLLEMCVMVEESERDLQSLVFERLSTLTRLEVLSMLPPPMDADDMNVLEFRLDCGMDKLAGLQRMVSLYFDVFNPTWPMDHEGTPYYPQLEVDEVAWMMEHWKRLEKIRGHLNTDEHVEALLRSELESHGIDCRLLG